MMQRMIVQMPAPPAPPPGAPLPPDFGMPQEVIVRTDPSLLATLPPPALFLLIVVGVIVMGVVFYPLVQALARRIGGREDAVDPAELDELRQRLAELEERQQRMHELEERIDFAERLLAERAREAGRLEAGGGELRP